MKITKKLLLALLVAMSCGMADIVNAGFFSTIDELMQGFSDALDELVDEDIPQAINKACEDASPAQVNAFKTGVQRSAQSVANDVQAGTKTAQQGLNSFTQSVKNEAGKAGLSLADTEEATTSLVDIFRDFLNKIIELFS